MASGFCPLVVAAGSFWFRSQIARKQSAATPAVYSHTNWWAMEFCGFRAAAAKANKQWIWLAYHPESHQVNGCKIGNRDVNTFKKLWRKLPLYWRKNFDFATHCLQAYKSLIPNLQHFSEKSFTQQIEAFNGRIRSRCSRLVRKTRSFSKVKKYHEQAIRFFLYKSNLEYQITQLNT